MNVAYFFKKRPIRLTIKILLHEIKVCLKSVFSTLNRTRLIFLIAILFFETYFSPVKVPIPFHVSLNEQVSSQFLSAIISTLSAILAIALAIIFIAFEISYKTFHTYVKKTFLENEKFRELSILYISVVIFAAISAVSLEESIRSFNLIVASLSLFVICLIVLFPYTKSIITSVISTEDIKKLAKSLDKRITSVRARRGLPVRILPSYIENIENDPLFVLGEAACNYIREDNTLRALFIVVETTTKLLLNAEKTDDFRAFVREYLSFYNKICRQAFKTENEDVLKVVFESFEEIHGFCATNGIKWHEMIELNEAIESNIGKSISRNLHEASRDAMYMVPRIFEYHLKKNVPKQEDLWDFNRDKAKKPESIDYDASNHWGHVSRDYIGMQSALTRVAIDAGLAQITSVGIQGLYSMAESIISVNNLGDKQIGEIVRNLSYNAKSLLLSCSEKDFWYEMVKITPFEAFKLTRYIDEDKPYSNILLLDGSELQLKLLRDGRLPVFELNDLGTTGRHCIHKIKNKGDIYERSVEFLVKVFSDMRKLLEKDLSEKKYELYLEVYKQLDSFRRWKGKKSKALSTRITQELKKFTKIKKVNAHIRKNTIKWPKDVAKG